MVKKENQKQSEINNIVAILAIFVVLIATGNLIVTMTKVADFNEEMTGLATAYVNITVNTNIEINITNDVTDWGPGIVNTSQGVNATLRTNGNNTDGTVLRGNWSSTGVRAITFENIGTVNVSITINNTQNASDLFNSLSDTNQKYEWNITNKDPNACGEQGKVDFDTWFNANLTQMVICNKLNFADNKNGMMFDSRLTVPYDANVSAVQDRSDKITITADAAL